MLEHRIHDPEVMDRLDAGEKVAAQEFLTLRRINQVTGSYKIYSSRLQGFWPDGIPPDEVHILDLATGIADVPLSLISWGLKRGWNFKITGVDIHPHALKIAHESNCHRNHLTILKFNLLEDSFPSGSFDLVICSTAFHHFQENEILTIWKKALKWARRGLIFQDLQRSRFCYSVVKCLTLFSNPVSKHDALLSVRKGFTLREWENMAREAALPDFTVESHLKSKVVLTCHKS